MSTTAGTSVNAAINARPNSRPSTANTSQKHTDRNTPLTATASASACFFWPSRRESSAFTPTPAPVATAIISSCTGNASETAVSASSLMRATNALSTILYSACTSMDSMIGKDIVTISLPSGMVPILFSDDIPVPSMSDRGYILIIPENRRTEKACRRIGKPWMRKMFARQRVLFSRSVSGIKTGDMCLGFDTGGDVVCRIGAQTSPDALSARQRGKAGSFAAVAANDYRSIIICR